MEPTWAYGFSFTGEGSPGAFDDWAYNPDAPISRHLDVGYSGYGDEQSPVVYIKSTFTHSLDGLTSPVKANHMVSYAELVALDAARFHLDAVIRAGEDFEEEWEATPKNAQWILWVSYG